MQPGHVLRGRQVGVSRVDGARQCRRHAGGSLYGGGTFANGCQRKKHRDLCVGNQSWPDGGPAIAGTVFSVAGLRAVGWLSVGLLVVPIFLTSVAIRQFKAKHAEAAVA